MDNTTKEKGILAKLENAIAHGNANRVKTLSNSENQITNLVILACKYNKLKILEYLFNTDSIINTKLQPETQDDTNHNAFYYAIRSGNVTLLDTLINHYFADKFTQLDTILSKAYDELILKNIPLSDEIIFAVESQLIDLRFFSDNNDDDDVKISLNNINDRIGLILENITFLNADYSNEKDPDEIFIFRSKFIAQNIHILKRQLKSTYNVLPWEEIEFCLFTFISSNTKDEEINLFYQTILDKQKILNHLANFAKKLQTEQSIINTLETSKLDRLPKLQRDKLITNIITNNPDFKDLYDDYQQLRDLHTLTKINNHIELALSTDPKEKQGQLVITRVLQRIGEYFKNTLESPKLSNTTNELLLLSLPENTRKIIIDLRNSLSHSYNETNEINFYNRIQNDIKKIASKITDILYKTKIKIIQQILTNLLNTKNFNEIHKIGKILHNCHFDQLNMDTYKLTEIEKIEQLIKQFNDIIIDKTDYEIELFDKINEIINLEKTKLPKNKISYKNVHYSLTYIGVRITNTINSDMKLKFIKQYCDITLKNITPNINTTKIKEIHYYLQNISSSAESRLQHDIIKQLQYLSADIMFITIFETSTIKWINRFNDNLYHNQKSTKNDTLKNHQQYEVKLSELKKILNNEIYSNFKTNKKLQAIVEILLLDIMSILDNSLKNNFDFLDDNSPLLIGKSLRNHLAHHNVLIDILSPDPSIAIILNANKILTKNLIQNTKKIGKSLNDNLFTLKTKYNRGIDILKSQQNMFIALQEGNYEILNDCLKQGADIYARSGNLSTALHYAAKSSNLEIVKFLINQHNLSVNAKDINNQTPLHISAAYGRKNIIEYFLKSTINININITDRDDKIPLHLAAENNHKDTVEILLKYNSNTLMTDNLGFSPLHYALINIHIEIFKILLKNEIHVDSNQTNVGRTSLDIAAEYGYLDLVKFLLENNANVNAKNDGNRTPLHRAAINGHSEIVKILISKGADVNAKMAEDLTALYFAAENGNLEIVNILLENGANANAIERVYYKTPLHLVAQYGHVEIFKLLLKYDANINILNYAGISVLHFAARYGNIDILKILLERNVNINIKDKNDCTPLHCVAETGHTDIVKILIENNAKINAQDRNHLTPLHWAARSGHKDIVDILINNKANINQQDIMGQTPILLAAAYGHANVIELLVKNNAEINARYYAGVTPLSMAAANGHRDAVNILIKNNADVNMNGKFKKTPLHLAVEKGYLKCVELLLKANAKVDLIDSSNQTPLYIAASEGHKEILEMLLAKGANVRTITNCNPLLGAIKSNNKEILQILIKNKADLNYESPITIAVTLGCRVIVKILLKKQVNLNILNPEKCTLLHVAALYGHKDIVSDLIQYGLNVNAECLDNSTPLFLASQEGHDEIIEILLSNGANINATTDKSSPLHIAIEMGHYTTVEVLVKNSADINLKLKHTTPLIFAVELGHLQIVKLLLQYNGVDINEKYDNNLTILHIAAQYGRLEITSYLVNKGANTNAKDIKNTKPLHLAVAMGHQNITEFYISRGFNINDLGLANQTPLHYCAATNHLNIAEYLIQQGADINSKDDNGQTPLHIAAMYSSKEFVEILLKNGAIYNELDFLNRMPINVAQDITVIRPLITTNELFKAVENNSLSLVEMHIEAGASVNAKNVKHFRPLHYAAWKGYEQVINILLLNNANPNVTCKKLKSTPLHYAAKFKHLKVVQLLLSNGAVYNATSLSGKTPYDFTTDVCIKDLFNLIDATFEHVKNDNYRVITYLNKINDIDILKSIMNAHNRENQTLIVFAEHMDFSKIEELKSISQGDVINEISKASKLAEDCKYEESMCILKNALEKRKSILGPENPGTLDIQTLLAKVLAEQGSHLEALNILQDILCKQKTMLGCYNKAIRFTKMTIAEVLRKQEKYNEALTIYEELYQNLILILGPLHFEILDIQHLMAVVLFSANRLNEALNLSKDVFQKHTLILGPNHLATLNTKSIMAFILNDQGKHEETLLILKEIHKQHEEIFGENHEYTLVALNHVATTFLKLRKPNEAERIYEKIFNIKTIKLGSSHPDTLIAQLFFANFLRQQFKLISALNVYRDCLKKSVATFGLNHSIVLKISKFIEQISEQLEITGRRAILQSSMNDINIAAKKSDKQTLMRLLTEGVDVNEKDLDGRTPLHYAVSNNDIDLVNILLKNDADVSQVTQVKGNTPLHTATSKNYKQIVEILLRNNKKMEFVNKKTTISGNTALHIAGKNGSLAVVRSLLKRGSIFDIKNNESKTPLDVCTKENVKNLLKLIEELFESAQNCNFEIIERIKSLKSDDFLAITNARNSQLATVLEDAVVHRNKCIGRELNMTNFAKTSSDDLRTAARNGDIETVGRLLNYGANVNDKDNNGRTALHFAISNEHINVVNILLAHGVDITQVTNKGNSALHIATSKDKVEFVELLLNHISGKKLNDFINAKTTATGTTALHIAAKNGCLDTTRCLLERGAVYNEINNEVKTPQDLSASKDITNLLNLIDDLFTEAKSGNFKVIERIKSVKSDDFLAITNARNIQHDTMLQGDIVNEKIYIQAIT